MVSRMVGFALLAVVVLCSPLFSQQVADTSFTPGIASPAYIDGTGPLILLDEAHHNFHTLDGRYLAFARLVRRDGYRIEPQRGPFTRADLNRAKVLIIANPIANENENDWSLPTPSAFDSTEIAVVKAWVNDGGSLWLIADHMPFGGATEQLAAAFGILMTNGFAIDQRTPDGRIRFVKADGSLADHPITRGRTAAERVDSVVSFTGQGFRLEGSGAPLMTLGHNVQLLLPQVAWQFSKLTPAISASGLLQGAVVSVGKGRVAAFGEAAMFSAQVSGPNRNPAGMNDPIARHNPQFLLNILHWLTGLM